MAERLPKSTPAAEPEIECVTLGPFETNCYVVGAPAEAGAAASGADARECWIVDASFEPADLVGAVHRRGLRPSALILTHAHVDHIAGVAEVRRAFPGLPVVIHKAEADWLSDPLLNLSALMGMAVTAPGPDKTLAHGDHLDLAGTRWQVIHTPGHSPGGIALYHERSGTLLGGDALFAGSIGRTDFPGSDQDALVRSIRERLYTLPDATRVYAGHGPVTTIGREKRSNPFVRAG